MDNFFITRDFDWQIRRSSHVDRALNLFTRRLGLNMDTAGFIDQLIHKFTGLRFSPSHSGISTNVEQRMNMYHLVSQVIAYGIDGDLVEVGCNEGQSSVLISKVMKSFHSSKRLHVYDSFEGLPAARSEDGGAYRKGDLATSRDVLIDNFAIHGLELPVIHTGWFEDTLPHGLPDCICFAYLDGDLYGSILVSLEYVYPRLSKGAVCLIDDYCDPAVDPDGWNYLPGVKKACDEFMADKPEPICSLYSGSFSHAFFRKALT
ncbi:methyltransferase [Rhizobium sp. R72]|uniref:TylF/MycF/NovP-related O-methyltransferase n=1 Tax=unclassified Rhizobium TaxID=2613769 RepID=UPI000B531AE2|nr:MULTISPECIES: TylF/MycF/NovP-related O-methyltransferase [unclassified Rhizobium]OWW00111.1 methyltransferase [Rhizobium sp. R72]OWW00502.1 methyltransferase [Rhizobium sp. R711]